MSLADKLADNYIYKDYLSWPEDERWEIIDGEAYSMSPAPSRLHQELSGILFGELYSFLKKGKQCKVFSAPFDVKFPVGKERDEDITTVVQPDISVVCDFAKLDDRGCKGAPDLIIEILSPATGAKDMKMKFHLYEKHGVREYWLVLPEERSVMIFHLKDGEYGKPEIFTFEDELFSRVLEGLKLDLKELFENVM